MKKLIGIYITEDNFDICWLINDEKGMCVHKGFNNSISGYDEFVYWVKHHVDDDLSNLHIIILENNESHVELGYFLRFSYVRVSIINTLHIYYFNESYFDCYKNPELNSLTIAKYGWARNPNIWLAAPTENFALKLLNQRLQKVQQEIELEKINLSTMVDVYGFKALIKIIKANLKSLNYQESLLEKCIQIHINKHPKLQQNIEEVRKKNHVGDVTAACLLSSMYEGA